MRTELVDPNAPQNPAVAASLGGATAVWMPDADVFLIALDVLPPDEVDLRDDAESA